MFSYLRLLAMMPLLRAFMLLDVTIMDDGSEEITYRPEMGTRRERMQLIERLKQATSHYDKASLERLVSDVECGEYLPRYR